MILRSIIAVLLLLCWLAGGAQVRPDQFTQETSPNNANFEVYSQKGGLNRRAALIDLKKYFTPDIVQAWQAFTFTDSTGVADSLRMQFLKDVNGRVFYVDQDGDALLLRDTASALGRVYLLPTLADTSTVASPVMGDVGIVGADTLLFYETYWVPFTKGAGGIYSGSGAVPPNTWAEFLGAVRFDIDSLGSFSVGDIDEKNSGAVISVSNGFGHDGRIIIKSGSGAGFTTGQVQVNNYYLPGKPPSSESLPTGTYMWLVNQAGAKAGTSGTGWFHIDSLLNGYVLGAGTVNTVPLWTASNTLGNSALTQPSATEMSMGTLTGALTLPTGTAAQDPVWANGKLKFETTTGGFKGGPSGLFLPFSVTPTFTDNRIILGGGSSGQKQSTWSINGEIANVSTTGRINWGTSAPGTYILGSNSIPNRGLLINVGQDIHNAAAVFRSDGSTLHAVIGRLQSGSYGSSSASPYVGIGFNNMSGLTQSGVEVSGYKGASGTGSNNNGGTLTVTGGISTNSNWAAGSLILSGGKKGPGWSGFSSGTAGDVTIGTYPNHDNETDHLADNVFRPIHIFRNTTYAWEWYQRKATTTTLKP
jgi:hypothetical protein